MAIATAIAVGGLAITAATTANSFVQAGKAKTKQRQAEASAAQAMQAARGKLEINYTNELAINKDPYELQREAMLSAGAQAIQAGVESDRGAATTVGKVMMAQNEGQAGIATAMSKELTDINQQKVAEASRLRDLNVQLDLGEVAGQQEIARQAETDAAQQKAQGIQGATSFAQQGLNMLPLYFKDGSTGDKGGFNPSPLPPANTDFNNPFGTQAQNMFSSNTPWTSMSGVGGR